MVEITVQMTALDYGYMFVSSGQWAETFGKDSDEELAKRFFNETNPGQIPGRHWKQYDAISGDRVGLMLARSFLEARGIAYEIVYDKSMYPAGGEIGWCILSDYVNYHDPEVAEDRAKRLSATMSAGRG